MVVAAHPLIYAFDSVTVVRVPTVNIRARNGLYSTRERLLRQSIGVLAPDLLALQEVDAGPGNSNQAEELFSSLGYSVDYERRDGDNRADPGIAVASRHPTTGREVIELPNGGAALAVRALALDAPLADLDATPDAASMRFLTGLQSLAGTQHVLARRVDGGGGSSCAAAAWS